MQVDEQVKLGGVAVEADGLVLTHNGDVSLGASSFSLPRGAVTAVVGPNGAGKTIVLDAVAGLLRPAAGRLRVLGGAPHEVRDRVAYVLQAPQVDEDIPITAREVVTLGRFATRGLLGRLTDDDRRIVRECMERLEVGALADSHLRELSAGQRQRVLVAQTLAQRPELLLMDEPRTSLDLAGSELIERVIAAERDAGRTVLVTTHALDEAMRADHVLLLAGRAVVSGPPDEVLTAEHLSEVYRGHVLELAGSVTLVDDAVHDHAR